jgi:hypothetical protein
MSLVVTESTAKLATWLSFGVIDPAVLVRYEAQGVGVTVNESYR